MPSAAHNAWVKATLGLDAAASSVAGAPLPPPAADKQSQAFHSAFQAVLTPIDEAVKYLSAHAEAAKCEAVSGKRATLVAGYQAAAAKVDAADENKAKGAITQALGAVKAVGSQADAAKKAAEKAYEDWKSRTPRVEETVAQIGEVTEWGHPKAPPLNAPMEAMHGQAEARKYTEASAGFDKLGPQVKPVYDDYVKQKAAQAEYEPARTALDPRLAKAAACTFKTLQKMAAELPAVQAGMDKDVAAKDFVHALEKAKDCATKLDTFEKALADLEAKKKAYEDELATVKPKLDATAAVDHPKLKPMQQELTTLQAPMEQKATAEDFDGALKAAQDLGTKADQFDQAVKELEAKKKQYEDALAALQPRLDGASKCEFKKLEPLQQELTKAAEAMAAQATAEDYDPAIKAAADLATRLDEFEKSVKELEEKKKAYDDARTALDPKLAAMAQGTPHKKLETDKKAIDDAVPIMEKAAGEQDYDIAQQSAADLGTKVDKYTEDAKAIDDKKKQYEDAFAKVQPRLDEMKSTRIDDLAPMQQEILKKADDIKKAADEEDYDTALKSTEALSTEFDAYENADASKIYSMEWQGKTYYGNEKDLAAVKLALVQAGIKQVLPPLKNRAESYEGRYNDLKALNDQQYIVAFFVQGLGGADLGTVGSAISTHQGALSSLQSATSDADAAKSAYEKVVTAVNATGTAIDAYMDKLDSGGKRAITALQVVEVTAFAIAAACGGAILLPEGASILASMAANGISGTAFGALEATAQQYAPKIVDGKDVDFNKAKVEIGKAALLNGVGGLLGGAMGGKLKADVGAQVIKKLAIDNPAVKARVLGALEGAMGNLVQAAISNRPDLASGKMTTGEFVTILVENAIAGGLGGAITPGMNKVLH